ncbi:nonstructural protein [Capybara microvirus Cap1_SP_168]|nr:nonstructural protein [Capybara microvirus Cap1_SP_168]
MKGVLVSVYDRKGEMFNPPQFERNNEIAIRHFVVAFCNKNIPEYYKIEDFDLYQLATWDDETGELWPCLTEITSGKVHSFAVSKMVDYASDIAKITLESSGDPSEVF